ncbi:Crp/Fnr family transcriptional regulator [Nitriliruptoria bacterium AS10]|nr:Crp/Fnr family transcriptional regulator [Salsipaludibacter albus]MBY5163383.1 Crp/Fnr family transcriptional regulator [Salsipaludibacter albus]
MVRGSEVDVDLSDALAASALRTVPSELLGHLLADAIEEVVEEGSITHRQGDATAHLELVVSGVVRVFVTAPDGRTMTIRYCRRGGLLGAMSLYRDGFVMPATTQALVETRVLRFSPRRVVDMVGHRPVAEALLREVSARADRFLDEIAGNAFSTVRQRVVRHLLDLAADHHGARQADGVVVSVSQQELADAAGTVREVVVRTLRELRDEGLVETGRTTILVRDPARLAAEEEWNLSS